MTLFVTPLVVFDTTFALFAGLQMSDQFANFPSDYKNTLETKHVSSWEIAPEDALDVKVNPLPDDPSVLAFASCELRCRVSRLPEFFLTNIMLIVFCIVAIVRQHDCGVCVCVACVWRVCVCVCVCVWGCVGRVCMWVRVGRGGISVSRQVGVLLLPPHVGCR